MGRCLDWEKLTFSNIQEKGKLQAEVQAHHQVTPIVYACPDKQLLNREKAEQGKKGKYMPVHGSLLCCVVD